MSTSNGAHGVGALKRIELIYFEDCPNFPAARANLRAALEAQGTDVEVREWRQGDPNAPGYVTSHASPTVLVDGRDVTGAPSGDGLSCRAEGAPSVEVIRRALARP